MDFTNLDDLNQANVNYDSNGNKTLSNSNTIASQQQGIFPNTTKTIVNQDVVATTTEGVNGETKIFQEGRFTGYMKKGVLGEDNLFDTQHNLIGTMNENGNVKQLLANNDPLSISNVINFQELKFKVNE